MAGNHLANTEVIIYSKTTGKNLKSKFEYFAVLWYLAICIASIIAMIFVLGMPEPKKLNCGIAEISPDYSVADRQRCREERIRQASQKHNL